MKERPISLHARESDVPRHALILGCGRSGTSIFGELFEAIPGYCYLSEPDFASLTRRVFATPTAIKVPKESEQYPATNGLSFPIGMLSKTWPHAPVVFWQVRHPLDAIASLQVGIANNWGHHPRPRDWEGWTGRPLLQRCAHHWLTINTQGFNAVRGLAQVCRFETMLADPQGFADSVCASVGVCSADIAERLTPWVERVQNSNNEKFIEARTSRRNSRPDHSVRVGRWRENLSSQEVDQLWNMVHEVAQSFGYDLD